MGRMETYTSGLRKLLFGEYRPENLLNRYREEEGQLFHLLSSRPKTPTDYLDLDPSLRERWGDLSDSEIIKQWPSDYYFIPDNIPEPSHILSTFYRVYIWCELRLTILCMLHKQSDSSIPAEVLQYDLITLRDAWLDMILECNERLYALKEIMARCQSESPAVNLKQYLLSRLLLTLEVSILELQVRFPMIPENRCVKRRDLYLKYLEQPTPDQVPYVRTLVCIQDDLKRWIQLPDCLNRIEDLMGQLQSQFSELSNPELMKHLNESIQVLENARLCADLYEEKSLTKITDEEQNRNRIGSLISHFQRGAEEKKTEEEEEAFYNILSSIQQYRRLFLSEYPQPSLKESEASRLVQMIDQYYIYPEYTEQDDRFRPESDERHIPPVKILDQYILLDEVKDKLNVHIKTLQKYLNGSGVEVIEFSAQKLLIHETELEKLLNYYKTVKKDPS